MLVRVVESSPGWRLVLRSRRLLRESHCRRRERLARAGSSATYDVVAEVARAASTLRALEYDGFLDPAALDGFEDGLTGAVLGYVLSQAEGVQRPLADILAARVCGSKSYARSLGRQLDVASSAVLHDALEERVFLAMTEVIRVLSGRRHELAPAAQPAGPAEMVAEELRLRPKAILAQVS